MISRILFGYLSDLPTVDTLTVIYISTTMTSVVVLCIPFCSSYITLSVAATLYGLFSCKTWHFLVFATVTILLSIFIFPIALFVSLSSIVLAEMLGTSQVVKSYGLLCVTYGVPTILGTPLAGN